jgi:hypothetical protein
MKNGGGQLIDFSVGSQFEGLSLIVERDTAAMPLNGWNIRAAAAPAVRQRLASAPRAALKLFKQ